MADRHRNSFSTLFFRLLDGPKSKLSFVVAVLANNLTFVTFLQSGNTSIQREKYGSDQHPIPQLHLVHRQGGEPPEPNPREFLVFPSSVNMIVLTMSGVRSGRPAGRSLRTQMESSPAAALSIPYLVYPQASLVRVYTGNDQSFEYCMHHTHNFSGLLPSLGR